MEAAEVHWGHIPQVSSRNREMIKKWKSQAQVTSVVVKFSLRIIQSHFDVIMHVHHVLQNGVYISINSLNWILGTFWNFLSGSYTFPKCTNTTLSLVISFEHLHVFNLCYLISNTQIAYGSRIGISVGCLLDAEYG